ncbi:hypothetical protein TRIUR3_16137 [Triticum urartu]|uniref:Uncharacterized protein n=1 Tax=Triticum urartu TaxID=4572 RepID=M8AEE0_TRIUA|nr:hypothetical protein TRIUR3_16137 [Triticum urartu]
MARELCASQLDVQERERKRIGWGQERQKQSNPTQLPLSRISLGHLQPLALQEGQKIAPWGRTGAKPRTGGVMPPSRASHGWRKSGSWERDWADFSAPAQKKTPEETFLDAAGAAPTSTPPGVDFVSIWNPSPARLPRPPSHPTGAARSGSFSSPSPSHASAGSGTELAEKASVVGSAAREAAARCGLVILLGISEIRLMTGAISLLIGYENVEQEDDSDASSDDEAIQNPNIILSKEDVYKRAQDNGYEEDEGAASTYLLSQKGHKKKHIMQQRINGLGPYETDVSYGPRCPPPLLRWKPEMLEKQ